jgi:glutamate dehydrogenase/leucine dehydrogenase
MIQWELKSGAYVPAPDMGTTPFDMAVIYGETHMAESVTGKPPRVGGLPGRREATGHGVAYAAGLAMQECLKRTPDGVSVAVQGFGNVGSYAALFLREFGCRVVAVSDVTGGLLNERGLDVPGLMRHVETHGSLAGYAEAQPISNGDLLALDVDVLCPCAREQEIRGDNAATVRARVIVEGANGPTTPEADDILLDRGVVVVPDILANSGGVVASYVEWRKAKSGSITEATETYQTIDERIRTALTRMCEFGVRHGVDNRTAAQAIAVEETILSMRDRGWV